MTDTIKAKVKHYTVGCITDGVGPKNRELELPASIAGKVELMKKLDCWLCLENIMTDDLALTITHEDCDVDMSILPGNATREQVVAAFVGMLEHLTRESVAEAVANA